VNVKLTDFGTSKSASSKAVEVVTAELSSNN